MRGAVAKPGLHLRLAEGFLVLGVLAAVAVRVLSPGEPGPLPAAEELLHRVDLNRAPWFELAHLPGIGPARAREIVRDREDRGPFRSPEELSRVHGIGPVTVEAIRDWLKAE